MNSKPILITLPTDLLCELDVLRIALQKTRTHFIRSAILREMNHYAEHEPSLVELGKSISKRPQTWAKQSKKEQ